jgi:hypothetical protein
MAMNNEIKRLETLGMITKQPLLSKQVRCSFNNHYTFRISITKKLHSDYEIFHRKQAVVILFHFGTVAFRDES